MEATTKGTHTPGPWKVGNRYGNLHTEIAAPGYTKAVAYCWTHRDASQKDDKARRLFNEDAEGIANACLIAASPDLLVACQKALADYEKYIPSAQVIPKILRAAIAKAEGGAS